MKVQLRQPYRETDEAGVTGEALSFFELDGDVYFVVAWHGRPGVQTIHSSRVEDPCSITQS